MTESLFRWITGNEEKPIAGEEVIVLLRNGQVANGVYCMKYTSGHEWKISIDGEFRSPSVPVVAWMPMPSRRLPRPDASK